MDLFKGNQGKGEAGFTLIELLVVIGILAVLAAVAIPAYSRFFGEGEVEANLSELSNIQASIDAFMAHHRILTVDVNATPTNEFHDQILIGGTLPLLVDTSTPPDGIPDITDPLYPNFLRIGSAATPTKCKYTWDATGFVAQLGDGVPGVSCTIP